MTEERNHPNPELKKIDEKTIDANIKIYESARSELVQRMVMRDSALLFYIGAVGSYFNFVINSHLSKPPTQTDLYGAMIIMLPMPFVCLIFSLVILQHHIIVGRIGAFLRWELNWGPVHEKFSHHWDNSKSFLEHANFLITLRLYAQGLILCLPLLYDIVFYFRFKHALCVYCGPDKAVNLFMSLQLLFNIITAVFITWLHYFAHNKRKRDW